MAETVKRKKKVHLPLVALTLLMLIVTGLLSINRLTITSHAVCSNLPTSRGNGSYSISTTTSGSYRVWVRMKTSDPSINTAYLQIDQTLCGVIVGGTNLGVDTWTWVNYQNGNTAATIDATLSLGAHTVYLAGAQDNVLIDRVILTQDTTCMPTGTGDNCTGTTTPTYLAADINQDGHVNLLDFSLLATDYGKTSGLHTARADINGDGAVNLLDFSLLAARYGT